MVLLVVTQTEMFGARTTRVSDEKKMQATKVGRLGLPDLTVYVHRGYEIECRAHEWVFVHEEYDGPEDGRIGSAKSFFDCLDQIDDELDGCDAACACGKPAVRGCM